MIRYLVASGCIMLLSGCQTNAQYVRIGAGPELPQALAQCEIMATGTQQGVIAWGSPSYVAGAHLGNAIANGIRQAQFMKNCMILQGWQQAPAGQSIQGQHQASTFHAPTPPPEAKNLVTAPFPPPPGNPLGPR